MSQTVVRFKDYVYDSVKPVITGERSLLRIQVFYFELNEARFSFFTQRDLVIRNLSAKYCPTAKKCTFRRNSSDSFSAPSVHM